MEEIRRIDRDSREYPYRLRQIPDPPRSLYVMGKIPEEGITSVAVIGARDCSEYGRSVAGRLGEKLGKAGIQVVSGMARGIDGISQEAAMDAGGSSFGVLGCGVDICYPRQNRRLYEKLKTGGGILSEYEPGTPPAAWHFPPRNRIVSGLADVLVVVEARAKSGTLITVDMALEQGREVYVVPGRVTDGLSAGCNRLIKLGAGVLLDMGEFLEELGEVHSMGKEQEPEEKAAIRKHLMKAQTGDGPGEDYGDAGLPFGLPPECKAVLKILDYYPKSMEQIERQLPDKICGKPLQIALVRLCLANLAIQVSPGHFCRERR